MYSSSQPLAYSCSGEGSCFPRLTLDGYAPFFGVMRQLHKQLEGLLVFASFVFINVLAIWYGLLWSFFYIVVGDREYGIWMYLDSSAWKCRKLGQAHTISMCRFLWRRSYEIRKFFDECWTKLGPEGLPDVTPRPCRDCGWGHGLVVLVGAVAEVYGGHIVSLRMEQSCPNDFNCFKDR